LAVLAVYKKEIKRDKGMTYGQYFGQKRKRGLISLRRKQWEVLISPLSPLNKKEKNNLSGVNSPVLNLNIKNFAVYIKKGLKATKC